MLLQLYKGNFIKEDVKGKILNFEVLWVFLDVFYGQGSLLDQVKLTSLMIHILYLGSAYVHHVGFGHYLDTNWLSRECIVDCIIACHASFCHIILMSDYFHQLPISLEKVDSDYCEDSFLLPSQHVLSKYNFCVVEVAQWTSCIGRVEKIKQEKDTIFFSNPSYCMNLWWEGNPIRRPYSLK